MGALGITTGQSRWTLLAIAAFFLGGATILLFVDEGEADQQLRAIGETPVHDGPSSG